jgi:hypothetical protein
MLWNCYLFIVQTNKKTSSLRGKQCGYVKKIINKKIWQLTSPDYNEEICGHLGESHVILAPRFFPKHSFSLIFFRIINCKKINDIYSEQSTSRSRDICFQSWPFYSQNRPGFFLKFWLWRPIPKNWGQTREFLLWLSLSWGTDYQINHKKTWFGRITSWIYNHPSAHCEWCGRIRSN